MASTAQRKVISPKSVIFSYGFRPFFLCASVWAVVAMSVWILVLSGRLVLPTTLDPVSWHAHEFLFGYLGAVIAGFILTAVPNWTARPAITGWPLARLFVLWLAGRLAIATSAHLPSLVFVITDLSFQLMLCTMVARELISARNWRNLIFVCLLCGQILGNAVFHWEVLLGEYAAHGTGFRIGLAASVMMIVVMGGRIVPNFTHNWLVSRGGAVRPAPTGMIDKLAILGILLALIFWIIVPEQEITAIALLLSGGTASCAFGSVVWTSKRFRATGMGVASRLCIHCARSNFSRHIDFVAFGDWRNCRSARVDDRCHWDYDCRCYDPCDSWAFGTRIACGHRDFGNLLFVSDCGFNANSGRDIEYSSDVTAHDFRCRLARSFHYFYRDLRSDAPKFAG